jgi:hypothetical protein
MRGLSVLLLAIGCAAPAQGPTPALPSSAVKDVPRAPSAKAPSEPSALHGGVTFHALPARAPSGRAPRIEIERPAFGDVIDPRLAERSAVTLRVLDAPASEVTVVVSLDGRRPRRFTAPEELVLRGLYPDDESLEAGAHLLLATALDGEGRALALEASPEPRPLALVGFSIGARAFPGIESSLPSLFCLSPTGTLYLAPGASALFQMLSLGGDGRTVPVRVRGRGVDFTSELDPARAYDVVGLPLGDMTFSVGRSPGPYAECVVTINPDTREGAER